MFVGERELEPIAEVEQRLLFELFGLMGKVAAFAAIAHAVALDGFGEDDGGLAVAFVGAAIGVIDFHRIVATARERTQLLVRHVFHHGGGFRILAEEVLADVRASLGFVGLEFAVDDF